MKNILFTTLLLSLHLYGCSQNNGQEKAIKTKKVGGSCEGCEAIYESPVSFEKLDATVTLPDFNEAGPKLEISGIVYQSDGKTPARNVVIYVYHTDQTGHYTKKGNEQGWGKRHGYIRGWMKTDSRGFYRFYTLLPAHYPDGKNPAHIHVTIKETDKNEYWIDEYLFDDDPILTPEQKKKTEDRGGNGILKLKKQNGMLYGERNIILGRNIPGY